MGTVDVEFFWDPICPWSWITSSSCGWPPPCATSSAGSKAVDLWEAVVVLGSNPHFSELKRSTRGRPTFDG